MGSIARMDRAARFIKEFNKDFVKRHAPAVGSKLTVVSCGLGQDDGPDDVKLFVTLRDEKGEEHTLSDSFVFFDPEMDGSDDPDTLERVSENLNISERTAKRRLKKADL